MRSGGGVVRSGYSEDCDGNELTMWRGAVNSAIRGKRGQAFLKELLLALDALPQKRLIAEELQAGCEVCAIGSVGLKRGVDMADIDVEDAERIGKVFGIAPALVKEIESINDDDLCWRNETPERRFIRVRNWVVEQIREAA